MPLDDGLILAFKEDGVELTANLVDPQRDGPETIRADLSDRLLEHRMTAMTDPDVLEGEELRVASLVVCRDPIPATLKPVLLEMGFEPEEPPPGASRTLFSRLTGGGRTRLERWRYDYSRASEVSESLHRFELECIRQTLERLDDPLPSALSACMQTYGYRPELDLEGLRRLEQSLAIRASHRLILHPAATSAIVAIVAATVLRLVPGSSQDPESSHLLIPGGNGPAIETDPEFRTVEFVRRGERASLRDYVEGLLPAE